MNLVGRKGLHFISIDNDGTLKQAPNLQSLIGENIKYDLATNVCDFYVYKPLFCPC